MKQYPIVILHLSLVYSKWKPDLFYLGQKAF